LEFKTQLLTIHGTTQCPKENWIKSLQRRYVDPRTNKYMDLSPKEKPNNETKKSVHADYAAEPSPPCCPRVFLASAHTNKLMIIARERITQQNIPQRK